MLNEALEERWRRKNSYYIPLARITGNRRDKGIMRGTRDPAFWEAMTKFRLNNVYRWLQQWYWRLLWRLHER